MTEGTLKYTIGSNMKTNEMIKVAIFPALIVATIWISIPMAGAPITLQTLFVLLAGMLLGRKLGAISMIVYLLLGVVGIPVFAGFSGGAGVIAGPTGGFLLSFPVAAYIAGLLKDKYNLYVAAFAATIVIYLIGIPWLASQLGMSLGAATSIMLVYIPGDIVKIVTAIIITERLKARI